MIRGRLGSVLRTIVAAVSAGEPWPLEARTMRSSSFVGARRALLAALRPACGTAAPGGRAAPRPAAGGEPFAGKTIILVVPNSAGGPTDIFARLVAQFLD